MDKRNNSQRRNISKKDQFHIMQEIVRGVPIEYKKIYLLN